jgi:hypothetical protein
MEKRLIITFTDRRFWDEAEAIVEKTNGLKGPSDYIAWKILTVLGADGTPLQDLGSACIPPNGMKIEYFGIGVQPDGTIDMGFGVRTSIHELTQKLSEYGLVASTGEELPEYFS